MTTAARVLKYELHNVVRSRAVLVYAAFLFLLTDVLFRFGGEGPRVVLSLLNVALLLVPLVSVVFGTMYVYGAREFTELLLAQPVARTSLFAGLYLGLSLPLAGAFLLGVGLPFVIHARPEAALWGPLGMLLTAGLLLTFVFTAVAMLLATLFDDRAKGLGGAILIWLGCAILYDGLILLLITMFRDYPLERPVLVLTLLNPIDLGRVLLLLQFDTAALMGYTGAVFEKFFGTTGGRVTVLVALVIQATVPLQLASRVFRRKDF
jgi:Cu-processing system permease protein